MSSDYGDEDDFMNGLLANMDESLLRTPVKPIPSSAPQERKQKPIVRPNFSSQGSKSNSTRTKSRPLAAPATRSLKPGVTFTPRKPGDEVAQITRLSDIDAALVDDIEETFTPPPEEEQLPKRVTAKTPAPPNAAPPYSPEPITRCIVKKFETQEIGWRHQIRVLAIDETSQEVLEIILKDDWVTTRLRS
ncbi:hypothetical protein FRC12_024784, partial [Ceratobasidium sp. 428]